jgi:uncharacterized membrane protein required for colicin V production
MTTSSYHNQCSLHELLIFWGRFFFDKILGFFLRNAFFGANLTKISFSMGKILQFFDTKFKKKNP